MSYACVGSYHLSPRHRRSISGAGQRTSAEDAAHRVLHEGMSKLSMSWTFQIFDVLGLLNSLAHSPKWFRDPTKTNLDAYSLIANKHWSSTRRKTRPRGCSASAK